MLRIIQSGVQTAIENMALDASLLQDLGDDPILHLYDWKNPSLTYGHFIRPENHIHLETAKTLGISLAKRPTGGGIVFHIWDYAFSFLLPSSHKHFSDNTLENYRFVNEIVLEVIQELFSLSAQIIPDSFVSIGEDCQHFCMARPTQYDVVYNGMKIAGAAQRKTKKGYLHQGTISLATPDDSLLQQLLKRDVVNAMSVFTFAPIDQKALPKTRNEIGRRLEKAFQKKLGISLG
ncbi:MAG TPA: lipoate--protein ligase family protein [Chlamydiales bacterium]|nr:lipoate--protein ligase family protein [Chlamydiales bacterium]